MARPSTNTLASSVAFIAAASSWWALVRRVRIPSGQERPSRKALQTNTVAATAAPRRDVRRALIRSGIFGKTDAHVVSALIEHMRHVCFSLGQAVFAQGDPGSRLYIIASGRVKLTFRHIDYGTREVTATAVTDVCAVAIECDQLLAWMAECPEITDQIMRLLARR
jgi:CRP/FNR family cyclic AMP-dependent transcriptional regulator